MFFKAFWIDFSFHMIDGWIYLILYHLYDIDLSNYITAIDRKILARANFEKKDTNIKYKNKNKNVFIFSFVFKKHFICRKKMV